MAEVDATPDISLNDSAVDDETEMITAADVLKKLEQAWINEKFAPDILEFQTDVVDCMMEQIEEMEENLQRLKKGDFRIGVHRLEFPRLIVLVQNFQIDRIRFLLTSYLRTRLEKIEKYCAEILDREKANAINDQPYRLSREEMQFAKTYYDSLVEHLKGTALQHMPQNMQNFEPLQTMPKPNVNSYVFLKAEETVEGLLLRIDGDERDDVIDLENGSQHLLPYNSVVHLLKTGSVSLI